MKKYMFLVLTLLITVSVKAQKDKIVGNWIETRHLRLDTLVTGMDLLNKDEGYWNGSKWLSPEYLMLAYVDVEEDDFIMSLTITKEEDFYWAIAGEWFKEKITYNPELEKYIITFPGYKYRTDIDMEVVYDEDTKTLQFVEYELGNIVYEFIRQE